VGGAVDHERDRGARVRIGGQLRQRPAIDAGIGDDDVLEAAPSQGQRLAQRECEDARVTGLLKDAAQRSGDPDRLRGHADRQSAGTRAQGVHIAIEGVGIDDGERASMSATARRSLGVTTRKVYRRTVP